MSRAAVLRHAIVPFASILGAAFAIAAPVGCHGSGGGGGGASNDAGDAAVVYENVPEIPADQQRDVVSSTIAWDYDRSKVIVATGDAGAVVRLDPKSPSGREVASIGGDLRSVAWAPDGGSVAVVDRGAQGVDASGGRVVFLDAATLAVDWTYTFDPGAGHPRAVIFDPASPRYAFVAVEDAGTVVVLDRDTHSLADTIAIGRLPAGLAASKDRDELLVTQRVDPTLHVIDRTEHTELHTIVLADSPANADATIPQGKPYAFESVAWAPDGKTAWVPHQTYAGDHPIQFQTTVFPTVSVIDEALRVEKTNDGAGAHKFPGRKELFAAIAVTKGDGNVQVVSGPCAAAIHPKGQRAYVLACTSDDLIVFDAVNGGATEILGLAASHPNGIVIDPTGSFAYVVGDQSKDLTTVDLAGGSPIEHPSVVGATPLLDKDPVDPAMRNAETLFFRASRDKTFADGAASYTLAGDSWMACASCHLDGLTTTNAFLFEASKLSTEALKTEARIGHRALKDFFSTAASPDAATFDPHDVIVAMEDMGGLAPDHTGKDRSGAVDPNAPSAAVTAVSRDLARIVARDMPIAPSWILQQKADPGVDPKYSTDAEASWCGSCHQAEYQAWQKSAHAHAGEDPFVAFSAKNEAAIGGTLSIRHCYGCHDPNGVRDGAPSLDKGRGVTCTSCHDVKILIGSGGNADVISKPRDWNAPHAGDGNLGLLQSAAFCGGCHQSFVPGNGLTTIDTLHEWQASPFAEAGKEKPCVDCHMPLLDDGKTHDHAAIGGNLALAARFPIAGASDAILQNLQRAAFVQATRNGTSIGVDVQATGVGHSLPTGVPDLRELWVELAGRDGSGNVVGTVGAPASDTGLIDDAGPRIGLDLADADGDVLRLHELFKAAKIPFDLRASPNETLHFDVDASSLFTNPSVASVDVTLHYRNLRPPFYRAALGDPNALPPNATLATVSVK